MTNREQRIIDITDAELRAGDNGDATLRFRGHAALFDVLSDDLGGFREQISPGAFKKTLKDGADVRLLVNHDPNLVLARTKAGTLKLSEDDSGLLAEAELADTSYARDLAAVMERGDVDQMSFGFRTIRDTWNSDTEPPTRTLEEVQLFDVSVVTYPAYPATSAELRTVVPYQDLAVADRDRAWDAGAANRRWREMSGSEEEPSSDYLRAFVWYDRPAADTFGAYKLQVADVVDGELQMVPRAVFAAAAALQGARGGVDIPEADVSRVQSHLGRYYQKMRDTFEDEGIVPPWERARALRSLVGFGEPDWPEVFSELREGKVLSKSSKQLVQAALDALAALLN